MKKCCTYVVPSHKKKAPTFLLKPLVLEMGIEPIHPKILDFESSASTNSATRASGRQNYKKIIIFNIKSENIIGINFY